MSISVSQFIPPRYPLGGNASCIFIDFNLDVTKIAVNAEEMGLGGEKHTGTSQEAQWRLKGVRSARGIVTRLSSKTLYLSPDMERLSHL